MKAKGTDPAPSGSRTRLIELGKVVKPHGLKGAVKVLVWSGSDENLHPGLSLSSVLEDGSKRHLKLQKISPLGNCFQFYFDGVNSPESAEQLRNAALFIDREELSDGLYLHDLKGAPVVLDSGTAVGTISDFWINPAGQTYGIIGEDRYVALFLPEVELVDGKVIVPARAVIESAEEADSE